MKTNFRIALVLTSDAASVAQYLPDNYKVIGRTIELGNVDIPLTHQGTLIAGADDHGWTLDDYVIPRLGSGGMPCREVERWGMDFLYEAS